MCIGLAGATIKALLNHKYKAKKHLNPASPRNISSHSCEYIVDTPSFGVEVGEIVGLVTSGFCLLLAENTTRCRKKSFDGIKKSAESDTSSRKDRCMIGISFRIPRALWVYFQPLTFLLFYVSM